MNGKFDTKWVESHAQCADGLAWGLAYVKDGGKDLKTALKGFGRADWLLWYAVKAAALPIESAFDLLWELVPARLSYPEPVKIVADWQEAPTLAREASRIDALKLIRGISAREAEGATTAGLMKLGHELSAVCFLARMNLRLIEGDEDEALKDGQCILNALVAAKTGSMNFETQEGRAEHVGLCDWLNSKIVVAEQA